MLDLTHRSSAPELMDNPELPTSELIPALNDITKVNKLLNGNLITVKAIEKLFEEFPDKKEWSIVDFGCGDGQMLRRIARYFEKHTNALHLIGVDLNAKSIQLGKNLSTEFPNISFEQRNILEVDEKAYDCDILLCTLTMHHFNDEEIIQFMQKFQKLAGIAIVVNDLERSAVAYQLFKVFSRIFMKSKIAKHDGRISIARSFKRKELEAYARELDLKNHSITWKWAFRYLWIIKTV
ncbi:methyltransferase domain-containing protein [Dokdonia sinensis]|uniref:Methyltransferase domain-containing protein n=1 Tax=Dokdonia sinensis TaxID=2479847 RepID=A0A3M0GED5_9FLAO|nr:methyltransferase domain-containing protein [Dokdonia sinensis]RMB61022.1 methyltransferase domain-containing protein [Dokdonia sinensis]